MDRTRTRSYPAVGLLLIAQLTVACGGDRGPGADPPVAAARAYLAVAVDHLALDQPDAARAAALQAVRLQPHDSRGHHVLATAHAQLGELEASRRHLQRAHELAPDDTTVRARLAWAFFEEGRLMESERHFRALADDPATAPFAHFGLGRITVLRGQHEARQPPSTIGRPSRPGRITPGCGWRRSPHC